MTDVPKFESNKDRDARTDREDRAEERDDRDRGHIESTEDRGHAREDKASALLADKRRSAVMILALLLFFVYQVYAKSVDDNSDPVLRNGVACLLERMDEYHKSVPALADSRCEPFLEEVRK